METLFENSNIKVYKNHCDEIFVENKSGEAFNKAKVRIGVSGNDTLEITADCCQWHPTSFNGLGGFRVKSQ